jgi:hypothetical protein
MVRAMSSFSQQPPKAGEADTDAKLSSSLRLPSGGARQIAEPIHLKLLSDLFNRIGHEQTLATSCDHVAVPHNRAAARDPVRLGYAALWLPYWHGSFGASWRLGK